MNGNYSYQLKIKKDLRKIVELIVLDREPLD